MQRLLGTDVNLHPEQLLKILNQPSVVEEAAPRFPVHQQVEVARGVGFTARHGAEHSQVAGAAPPRGVVLESAMPLSPAEVPTVPVRYAKTGSRR